MFLKNICPRLSYCSCLSDHLYDWDCKNAKHLSKSVKSNQVKRVTSVFLNLDHIFVSKWLMGTTVFENGPVLSEITAAAKEAAM